MAPILAAYWLAGTWYQSSGSFITISVIRDINGVLLNPGDIVNLQCQIQTILPINANAPPYASLILQPIHPDGAQPAVVAATSLEVNK
jgi:hypothetical protein